MSMRLRAFVLAASMLLNQDFATAEQRPLLSRIFTRVAPPKPPKLITKHLTIEKLAKRVTNEDLNLWLGYWQSIMQLGEWDIDAQLVRATELESGTLGNINWDKAKRKATIHALSPEDYKLSAKETREDIEYTIVHELAHLILSGLTRLNDERKIEEDAVNRMADSLFKLRALHEGLQFTARSGPHMPRHPVEPPKTETPARAGVPEADKLIPQF